MAPEAKYLVNYKGQKQNLDRMELW